MEPANFTVRKLSLRRARLRFAALPAPACNAEVRLRCSEDCKTNTTDGLTN